ncbi:response regulator receiver modulated metal-depenent phosphohydrolase [Geothrix rubra]|uniref:Response regulator receiver modulated metal-depenent phosphohydrolase n=1 Tax=Geothrix rubra TaxID=2927977 RepID=A0ABQ5Q4S5_9BACT|nr:HD domain-containing phosphohydrolase [Geothrix rubra]GLH69602.1 response regulator receiver modulated metal-depenent phosphohydrolase [Geothrix rubra]
MSSRILLVDDDENVLAGYHRVLRKAFDLDVALGAPQALQAMEHHGPYAVVVADMQMPGMNGVELLQKVREGWPGAIRLMLTGNQDQRTAIEAINQGRVFRFLTKPCSPEDLAAMLTAALRQHQLEHAERELLDQTLTGSLKVLTEILSVVDPHAFGRAEIIRQRAVQIAAALGMEPSWEMGVAAMMAPLGFVTVPSALAAKGRSGEPLSVEERDTLRRVPEFGAQLLGRIPRLESVAQIVRYQHKSYAGAGYPLDDVKGEAIPLGARILRALDDFQEIEERRGSRLVAMEQMKLRRGWYDPRVLQALEVLLVDSGQAPDPAVPRAVAVKDLEPGTVLAADVRTRGGMLVAAEGTRLLPSHVEKLQNFARLIGLAEPLYTKG